MSFRKASEQLRDGSWKVAAITNQEKKLPILGELYGLRADYIHLRRYVTASIVDMVYDGVEENRKNRITKKIAESVHKRLDSRKQILLPAKSSAKK